MREKECRNCRYYKAEDSRCYHESKDVEKGWETEADFSCRFGWKKQADDFDLEKYRQRIMKSNKFRVYTTFRDLKDVGMPNSMYRRIGEKVGGIRKHGRDKPILFSTIMTGKNGIEDLDWILYSDIVSVESHGMIFDEAENQVGSPYMGGEYMGVFEALKKFEKELAK